MSSEKSSVRLTEKASALAARFPLTRLHPAPLARVANRRNNGSETWCVALSGGADSVALLLLVWGLWPERRKRVVALHFNHKLRGRESDADEKFCRKVCADLGVKLRVGRWRRVVKRASEAEARQARHGFFEKEMGELGSALLWLAHQQDDIAESMLMRLARGSGTAGLAAPRPVQRVGDGRVHLRPLLTIKKKDLVVALRSVGVKWREDSSNAADDYFRNRVRRNVLPAWIEAAGRDAQAGAALARERLEEDDAALEAWVASLKLINRGRLDVNALAGLPRAIIRRALHGWLLSLKRPVDLSRQGFEQLLKAVEMGKPTRFSLSATGYAVLKQGGLKFSLR
ncbi:tRNA lysidine(34) synthetase TilS [Oleiharenicola lentus]|uniref:tRNA lysidine(34) synthetase TilS n=1 Tax=Oleiharenicola lentus TaxID=2508720 RepID=UPI003F6819C3